VVVPDGSTLVVDAMVLNRDAGFVREGQEVCTEEIRTAMEQAQLTNIRFEKMGNSRRLRRRITTSRTYGDG
jgi:hypothetical protein